MAVRLEPKSPFTHGPAIAPFSSKEIDPGKLGFTPETLGQRLPFGPTASNRYISFENLCNHILSILHDQWVCHNKTIILCRTNSMLILDCWDCGLPNGETYHKTIPENKKLSWVHQILEALQRTRFILSFQTDEGHIWVEKNECVSRLIPGNFFRNPEPIGLYENSDVQKSDAPSLPLGKGKDIPLLPPSYFKNIDPSKLGFTRETLDQSLSLGNDRYVRFETLCETLLPVICKQFCVFENTIILDETNEELILKSLDYGLPNGEKYQTTTPENKKLSWVYRILEALVKKHYILSFEIGEKYIRIEKSNRLPEIIPVSFLSNLAPISSVQAKPASINPAPTDALPSFKHLKTSKLDFTAETLDLTHDLGSSDSRRSISFQKICDRILSVVRSAFKWRRDNNILLDGSNEDNFVDVLDCGLPTGKNYHTAPPEIQKQSWVYLIFQSLQRTRYIKSFEIGLKAGLTEIRIVV